MRLYLAGADSSGDHLALDGLNSLAFLVSYWYIKHGKGWDVIRYSQEKGIPVFLDSGAFSAMTLGASIDIREYINFCREHSNKFAVMASLDVIGKWKETKENHDRMRQAGVNSIPAFHVREPFDSLRELVQSNDYIALGVAGNQKLRSKLMAWLVQCFKIIPTTCKVHGFALTSCYVMRCFPWYSVDSSTWVNARRFANVIITEKTGFRQVGRDQWKQIKSSHLVPSNVFVPRNAPKRQYDPLLRHNGKMMLEWVQSITNAN